jgi:hypothetical protein
MSTTSNSVPVEFEEAGIKPLTYGQPELAKAPSYNALARQVARNGIQDEAGNDLARPDKESADAIARQFVYPKDTAAAAFQAPIYKHLQAGTVALVHGPVLLTRVNPSPLNPRVGPMLNIPRPAKDGRVSVSWAPADVEVDPKADERLLQAATSVDELVAASRETASKVLGMQETLAGIVGREGIEEPLLMVQSRLEVGDPNKLARQLVPVAADGGSRITIAQEFLADAIELLLSEKEREYASRHKRRAGLESLGEALRAHQAASLIDDPVAERELRDFLVELSGRPAAELVKNKMYAAQRALVAPGMVVVGFRPNGSATILDAIDQLVANQHKRGPLQWQAAAQALDSRNSVVRGLLHKGEIGEGTALLLSPRYEEAHARFDIYKSPDFRIGEVVRIFHGNAARPLIRAAIGAGKVEPSDRAKIIAAVIGEQLRSADPEFRRQVETALNDMVGKEPFYGGPEVPKTDPDPDGLVARVQQSEQENPGVLSPDHVALGVKGGVALVLLGAISREHGARSYEFPRPYTILQKALRSKVGQELLGEGIKALRAKQAFLPARDPETGDPLGRDSENRVIQMNVENLWSVIDGTSTGDDDDDEPVTTVEDVLAELKSLVRNDILGRVDDLKERPEVASGGLPQVAAKEAAELLMDAAGEIDYLVRRGAEHLKVSADAPSGEVTGIGA